MENAVPKEQEIHIILDNYATHKDAKVTEWIERQKRVFLHFTPTSASWLNLVERFFSTLTRKRIRRGVFLRGRPREVPRGLYRDLQPEPEAPGLDEAGQHDPLKGGARPAGAGRRFRIVTVLIGTLQLVPVHKFATCCLR